MPYCKNCGHALPEGTGFCPECGTPVKAAPAPASAPVSSGAGDLERPPKGNGPNIALIAVIAVVVIALAATAAFFLFRLLNPDREADDPGDRSDYSDRSDSSKHSDSSDRSDYPDRPDGSDVPGLSTVDPEDHVTQFAALHMEMLDGVLNPLAQAPVTAPDRLSTDLILSIDINSPSLRPYLNNTYLTLRLDGEKDSFLLDGELTLMGSSILTGFLTYSNGTVGFCLPEADGVYYTLPLTNLLAAMTGMPVDRVDLSSLGGTTSNLTGQQLESMCRSYLDTLLSLAKEENVTCDKQADFQLTQLGGRYTGTVYTCTPTAKDMEELIQALADQLENDQDLRTLLSSFDGAEDELLRTIRDMRDNAASAGKSVEEGHFAWKLCVSDTDGAYAIFLEADNGTIGLEWYDTGREGGMTLYMAQDSYTDVLFANNYTSTPGNQTGTFVLYDDGWASFVAEYDLSTTGGRISGTCSLWSNGETVDVGFDFEKDSSAPLIPYGSYYIESNGQRILLDVEQDGSGAVSYTFTVHVEPDDPEADYDTVSITITTTETGTAQRPSVRPTDISRYSGEQLETLFEQLGETLSNNVTLALIQAMYGSMA